MQTLLNQSVEVVKLSASFNVGHRAKVIKETDRWLTLEGGKRISRKSVEPIAKKPLKSTKTKSTNQAPLWNEAHMEGGVKTTAANKDGVFASHSEETGTVMIHFSSLPDSSCTLILRGAQVTEHMLKRIALAVSRNEGSGFFLNELCMIIEGSTEHKIGCEDAPLNDRIRRLHTQGFSPRVIASATGATGSRVRSFINNKIKK